LEAFKNKVAKQPNIIVIITDDQGWGDIGYNNPKVYTPHLDALAASGVTFQNHYVMPQCTPTRVAAMTGRYPSRFGPHVQQASNDPAFPIGTTTLASMFGASGYNTYLCGKWHMGVSPEHGPNHHGFDYSYGSFAGAVGMYDHRYREGTLAETWHRNHKLIDGHENGKHATDLVAHDAIRIIKQKHEKPFFLYLAFHAPHTPLDERGEFVDQPTQLDPNDKTRWLNEDKIKWFNDPEGKIQSEPDPEKRLLLAVVYHLDHAIGELVKSLNETGLRDNTLILFSSDNGPQGSWPGNAYPDDLKLTGFNQPIPMRGKKSDTWEGGIHVPGFFNWPGRIDAKVVKQPVHIVDWFPTLAALIEYKPDSKMAFDGIDISSLVFANKDVGEREFHWIWGKRSDRWAFRYGNWKLVRYAKGAPEKATEWELYDLAADPKEKKNLASVKPEKLKKLHQRFLTQRAKDKVNQ